MNTPYDIGPPVPREVAHCPACDALGESLDDLTAVGVDGEALCESHASYVPCVTHPERYYPDDEACEACEEGTDHE